MKIKLHCVIHNADVIPAGDKLHWLPRNEVNVEHLFEGKETQERNFKFAHASEFELDYADLYCTGGEGDHEFLALITLNTGRKFVEVDNPEEIEDTSDKEIIADAVKNKTNKTDKTNETNKTNDLVSTVEVINEGECFYCSGLDGEHTQRDCYGARLNTTNSGC